MTPVSERTVIRNSACDLTGQAFVDIMTWAHVEVKKLQAVLGDDISYLKGLMDTLSEEGLYDIMMNRVNWAADINKITFGRVLSSKIAVTLSGYSRDMAGFIASNIANYNKVIDGFLYLVKSHLFSISYFPSVMQFLEEYQTSAIMMGISRATAYTPKQIVRSENYHECRFAKISEIYKSKNPDDQVLYYANHTEYMMENNIQECLVEHCGVQEGIVVIYDTPVASYLDPITDGVKGAYNYFLQYPSYIINSLCYYIL